MAPFYEVGGDQWPLQWQVQVQLADLPASCWDELNRNEESVDRPDGGRAIKKYKELLRPGWPRQLPDRHVHRPGQGALDGDGRDGHAASPRLQPSSRHQHGRARRADRLLPDLASGNAGPFSRTRPTAWWRSTPVTPSGRPPHGSSSPSGSARTTGTTWPAASSVGPTCPRPDGRRRRRPPSAGPARRSRGLPGQGPSSRRTSTWRSPTCSTARRRPEQVAQSAENQFAAVAKAARQPASDRTLAGPGPAAAAATEPTGGVTRGRTPPHGRSAQARPGTALPRRGRAGRRLTHQPGGSRCPRSPSSAFSSCCRTSSTSSTRSPTGRGSTPRSRSRAWTTSASSSRTARCGARCAPRWCTRAGGLLPEPVRTALALLLERDTRFNRFFRVLFFLPGAHLRPGRRLRLPALLEPDGALNAVLSSLAGGE